VITRATALGAEQMIQPKKPQGRKGAIHLSENGARWEIIKFPSEKRPRELMVANMFVRNANKLIMHESVEPLKYPPFRDLTQNDENDLDFTITISFGEQRLMELAEFAPLQAHGPEFKDAPLQLEPGRKADLLLELVGEKSDRHGGANRILLIYVTEHAFGVDPITIELARRTLNRNPPRFDRIYYISPHDEVEGGVWELSPGKPHHWFGEMSEQQLRRPGRVCFPHPSDFIKGG
jgi:hypothetical protein